MKRLFDNGHVTDAAFLALFGGQLDDGASLDVAQHIAQCESCAGRMVVFAEQCAAKPPRGMTEVVLEKLGSAAVKKKREFYRFCIRVAACVAVTVGLLVTGIIYLPDAPRTRTPVPPALTPAPEQAAVVAPVPGEQGTILDTIGNFFKDLPNMISKPEENENDTTKE